MQAPQRWTQIGKRLGDLVVFLNRLPETQAYRRTLGDEGWVETAMLLFAEEQKSREAVDGLVADYVRTAATRTGPDPRTAYFLWARALCALDFLGTTFLSATGVSPFGEIPADWKEPRIIEWLLLDLWRRRFDSWLKLTALEVTGPFPFYGLGSASDRPPTS